MIKAVVGANWGDEGKGKITDMLAKEADIIVRFQGGAQRDHELRTVLVVDDNTTHRTALHQQLATWGAIVTDDAGLAATARSHTFQRVRVQRGGCCPVGTVHRGGYGSGLASYCLSGWNLST